MTLIEKLKSHSSKWIKTKGSDFHKFYWQHGYGSFSVNLKDVRVVKEYIQNQEFHHKKATFQDEYQSFLKEYNVDYDEQFIWD